MPEARYYHSNAVLACNTDHKKKRLKFSTSFFCTTNNELVVTIQFVRNGICSGFCTFFSGFFTCSNCFFFNTFVVLSFHFFLEISITFVSCITLIQNSVDAIFYACRVCLVAVTFCTTCFSCF